MHERDILLATLELARPEEREAYLTQACGEDTQLRSRVEALLRAAEVQDSFLESPAAETESFSRETDPLRQPCAAAAELSLDFLQPSDDPSALGRLGPYTVTEVIGRGGMGVVLKARDTKLNRIVAIKVLAPELASNPTARKRFQREAHAAAAVVHQHVVTIHAVDEDRLPYLVMEYIDGQSLKEKIDREGNLKLVEIFRIGQQVASGLAAAHAHGLMHRDVKPANILLENGIERVRITDFGLARAVDDVGMTRTGEVAGTPEYMSPEQAQGLPMDGRSDLFSFGCVLYAMCTGRPPFRAETVFATARRVCEDTPRAVREVNPEIPQWLVAIIDRLLAKKPEDRVQTAAELAGLLGQRLAELQHPVAVTLRVTSPDAGQRPAPSEGHISRSEMATKRRWRLAALAAAILLLLAVTLTEATGVTHFAPTLLRIVTGEGTLLVEVNDPAVKVTVEGDGGLVITGAGLHEVHLKPGSYKLQADKNGRPVALEREVVSITKGGREVVRVKLEAGPAPAIAGSEKGAFVRLGGKGVAERKFGTLAEAVHSAGDGDTIEIRGNGPFITRPIVIVQQSLTIRAGEGYWPVIKADPEEQADCLLHSEGVLALEGLDFRWVNAKAGAPGRSMVASRGSAARLHVVNCRFLMNRCEGPHNMQCIGTRESALCQLRNCLLLVAGQGTVYPSGQFKGGPQSAIIVENCLIGQQLLFYVTHAQPMQVELNHNTILDPFMNIRHHHQLDLASGKPGAGAFEVKTSGNILGGPLLFVQPQEFLKSEVEFSGQECEQILKQVVRWRENGNFYSSPENSELLRLFLEPGNAPPRQRLALATPLNTLSEWKEFWALESLDSQRGEAKFQGGNLIAKAKLDPEALTPELFRLRPDSPGYRTGKDGKDLGADVDLVGPGPAYERWKKTPEYQEWLKEMGQLRAEAPKPEPKAFVLMGGKGVAERKFDTLIEAVQSASAGDTIEIRGNGPFVSDGVTIRHSLGIRAGEGYVPLITLSQASADSRVPLLNISAPLVLEGLELRRMGGATGAADDRLPFLLDAQHGGSLHIANCHLVFKAEPPCSGWPFHATVKSICVRNSILSGNVDGTSWMYASGGRCNIENCVSAVGGIGFSNADRDVRDVAIRVCGNTLVGNCLTLVTFGKLNLPAAVDAAPPIRLELFGNVAHWDVTTRNKGFLCFCQSGLKEPVSAEQVEAFLPRLVGLDEKQNLYRTGTPMLRVSADWQPLAGKRGQDLADWGRFWTQMVTSSVEGDIRFQGGDLVARAHIAPEELTAEDFRLRPDSAGYRAGEDGKDLGADIDLVGPGAAYERWKKTPQYQEWLMETGQ